MPAAGAPEHFHGQGRIARVQQDRVDLARDRLGFVHGLRARHVDDLDDADAGQGRAQVGERLIFVVGFAH